MTAPPGWRRETLADFIVLQRGFDLPARGRVSGEYKVLSSGDTSGSHNEARVKGPGFVVGRATNIGRPTWSDEDFWPLNTVLYAKDFRGNEPRFAYYWFLANDLSAYNSGSVQPMLNRNYIANVELDVPPIEEQRGIAETLAAIDQKIGSNYRLQHLVLDLAEAVYLEACERESSVVTLKDAGTWLSGGTPSTSAQEYWGGDLPWISAASLRGFFLETSDRRLTAAGATAATNVVPAGSIIFVVRGMSLKTEFRLGIAQRDVAFGQDCKAILPAINGAVLFVALHAMRDEILGLVDEAGHGTGRLQTDRLERLRVAVPTDLMFPKTLEELLARGAAAATENRALTRLRASLLPELVSGRLRVQEAASAVEAIA